MSYYIHDLSPFLWQWGPNLGIRWYGVSYALGLLIGWWILISLAKKNIINLDTKARGNFIIALLAGIIIGGRLGYMLLYDFSNFFRNPLIFFEFWKGGMASHGGFIGVAIACYLFSRFQKTSFLLLADAVCIMAPIGLLLGRLANFVNGELWGKVSYVPWAVVFPSSAPTGTPISLIPPRHPSQLYEAALEGLFLLIFTQLRYRCTKLLKPGQLAAEFLFLYALVRIISEQFREPDASLILGLSRGIFYSLIMIPISIWLWIYTGRKTSTPPSKGD